MNHSLKLTLWFTLYSAGRSAWRRHRKFLRLASNQQASHAAAAAAGQQQQIWLESSKRSAPRSLTYIASSTWISVRYYADDVPRAFVVLNLIWGADDDRPATTACGVPTCITKTNATKKNKSRERFCFDKMWTALPELPKTEYTRQKWHAKLSFALVSVSTFTCRLPLTEFIVHPCVLLRWNWWAELPRYAQ